VTVRLPDYSSFQMLILCPKGKWSGFQMAETRWPKIKFSARLDRLIQKKNICMTRLCIKWSFLLETFDQYKTGQFRQVFKWSAILFYIHSKTRHKLYPKNEHSKTGLSGFQMVTVLLS
jgi:hypothetical protein